MTISFVTQTASDTISLIVDMNDEQNKLANNGRTSSFIFGDEAFFRVFTNPVEGVELYAFQSDGELARQNVIDDVHEQLSADLQEYAVFTQPPETNGGVVEDNTANLSKPVSDPNPPAFTAEGLPPGASPCGIVSVSPEDPAVLQASQANPGVYDVNYKAKYFSFSIKKDTIPPGFPEDEPYPIVIVIVGV